MAYMSPERFEGGRDRSALRRLRADVCALRMPDRLAALSGGQPRAADRRAHQCPGAASRRPSTPSWPRSTTSSPRAWPRSRGSAIRSAGELAAAARQALSAPVRTTGGSGRHSAGRVKQKSGRGVSGADLGDLRVPRCWSVAALVFGAWQLWGGRGDGGSAGPTPTSSTPGPADGSGGLVPAIAATVPADIRSTRAGWWSA